MALVKYGKDGPILTIKLPTLLPMWMFAWCWSFDDSLYLYVTWQSNGAFERGFHGLECRQSMVLKTSEGVGIRRSVEAPCRVKSESVTPRQPPKVILSSW